MSRYLAYTELPTPPKADPKVELIACITKLTTEYPPQASYDRHACHGLYSGPTSIAYLFHHLARTYPDLNIAQKTPDSWCSAYLASSRPHSNVSGNNCGIANERLAHTAVAAAHLGHVQDVDLSIYSAPQSTGAISNEWLYGRAGTMYLLRLMRPCYAQRHDEIDLMMSNIVNTILSEGPPWPWHGKDYLGAAHGSIGILTQILLSFPHRLPEVTDALNDLLSQQDPETRNWPSSPGSSPERLVQFCHGAPGFVISLLAIRRLIHKLPKATSTEDLHSEIQADLTKRIDSAIEKGRECIAKRGLLTKEPNLCHGAVGNAMAFERGDERRKIFMQWSTASMREKGLKEGWFLEGDDPSGLFCGEAGRAWAWMVECNATAGVQGEGDGFLGYTDV